MSAAGASGSVRVRLRMVGARGGSPEASPIGLRSGKGGVVPRHLQHSYMKRRWDSRTPSGREADGRDRYAV